MTSVADTLDIDHLRGWIGREQRLDDVLTVDLARKYKATLALPGPPPRIGDSTPRLIHFCLAQPAVEPEGLGPDGHPARGGFLPPVPLPRRMWAGGALAFHGDLTVGDEVQRISRVGDVTIKDGRTGPLCFVTVAHRIVVDGTVRVEERQDLVFRAMTDAARRDNFPSSPDHFQHHRAMTADATLLFRYSALTFNGHRIHYDRRYATEVEAYPGLVVHGPLQAALLFDFASELMGAPPDRFRFRGSAPLFDGENFELRAAREGNRLTLWTARQDGTPCLTAEAEALPSDNPAPPAFHAA